MDWHKKINGVGKFGMETQQNDVVEGGKTPAERRPGRDSHIIEMHT